MMSYDLVGSVSWPVFFFLTIVLFGWVSVMAAAALARMWRPWWQNIAYGLIRGLADRIANVFNASKNGGDQVYECGVRLDDPTRQHVSTESCADQRLPPSQRR